MATSSQNCWWEGSGRRAEAELPQPELGPCTASKVPELPAAEALLREMASDILIPTQLADCPVPGCPYLFFHTALVSAGSLLLTGVSQGEVIQTRGPEAYSVHTRNNRPREVKVLI